MTVLLIIAGLLMMWSLLDGGTAAATKRSFFCM